MKINSKTPFTTRTQIAARGIHGSFDQRNASINVPLKARDDMQLYNTILGDPSQVKPPEKIKKGDEIIAENSLVKVKAGGSGELDKTFENPEAKVDLNKDAKPEYSFLDNTGSGSTDYSANLRNDPNRNNFFGTWKRTEGSFDERIKQATADGKYNKVKRLEEKRDNFRANNIANKPPEES